jgi:hypothetical protein
MSTAELKLKIISTLDDFDQSKLEHFYGLLTKYNEAEKDALNWESISKTQQDGLLAAVNEMNNSAGIDHQTIINKYKQKYAESN